MISSTKKNIHNFLIFSTLFSFYLLISIKYSYSLFVILFYFLFPKIYNSFIFYFQLLSIIILFYIFKKCLYIINVLFIFFQFMKQWKNINKCIKEDNGEEKEEKEEEE